MRAVAQRVRRAEVRVGDALVSSMEDGLLVLVGVGAEDGEDEARELARRLVGLRIFPDDDGKMNRSLQDIGGTLGIVSQFTLYGDTRQGRRPFFGAAAAPDRAEPLIELLVESARSLGVSVVTGRFGAMMDVSLTNAGPVTILLDTEKQF